MGPLAPTMKTLEQAEPRVPIGPDTTPGDANSIYRIAQPGSYYLTGSVTSTGAVGEHAIEIAASGVTIDLRGFELIGAGQSGDAIAADGAIEEIRIHSGRIRDWGGSGIYLWNVPGCIVEDIVASHNADAGIRLGDTAVVTRCVARFNDGINGGEGIQTAFGGAISDCVAESNAGDGISCSTGSIDGCTARLNGFYGIANSIGVISNCSADQNSGIGIGTTSGAIRSCVSRLNGSDGFWAADSSTIIDCTSLANTGNGIHVRNTCRIADNFCRSNGLNAADAAGIYVEEDSCHLEGNTVILNDRGIDVDGTDNIVLANTAHGNTTNYDIVAGNALGPIANFAGAGITTNNPWTNFEY
jgi:parallel beta-helix repeat protein